MDYPASLRPFFIGDLHCLGCWGPASGHLRPILDRYVGAKANNPQ
jgi:hypothetical protein